METPQNTEPVRQYRFSPPPGACDIILIRHGESQPAHLDTEFDMLDGQADPSLAPEGFHEADLVADRLRNEEISAVYTTPLTRTKQTAAPLAAALGITPAVAEDLREVHLGEWEGAEFRRRMAAGDPLVDRIVEEQDWGVIPGAETMKELKVRVQRGITQIAEDHPDERVAVFTHGGIIGAIMHMASDSNPFAFSSAANASLNHIVVVEDVWIVRRFNDTGHLHTDLDKPAGPLT